VPIVKLFVEGRLEVEAFAPILLGNPVPVLGGSQNSLSSRARNERHQDYKNPNKVTVDAGYLRDRDFDFDPPADLTRPTVDKVDAGVPFGWRWCRHEIENYLIDPVVVSEAMQWAMADVEQALRQAAITIRYYEAARWTIGIARRALPPHHELRTRPDGLNEIGLPPALDAAAVNAWASQSIDDHRAPMAAATDHAAVQASLQALAARFDDAFIADTGNILVWFSGKDLLAALADWIVAKGIANPGDFRARLRDWVIDNPVRAVELLPDWDGMIQLVRA
jgi:hypothetical protein